MAGKNQASTAAIDSVLADFGRRTDGPKPPNDASRRARQPRKNRTPQNATSHLDQLFLQLFPADLCQQLQVITAGLAGCNFDSLEANRMIVDKVNRILRGTDLCLISEDGTPVRLRLVKPARSKNGYFQLRSADAYQNTVYSGSQFPAVSIAEKP